MNLQYGKSTTREQNEDGTTTITKESFHKGNVKTKKSFLEIPIPVKDKSSALTEIIKGLELISVEKTRQVHFTIETNHDYSFKTVIRCYEVEE